MSHIHERDPFNGLEWFNLDYYIKNFNKQLLYQLSYKKPGLDNILLDYITLTSQDLVITFIQNHRYLLDTKINCYKYLPDNTGVVAQQDILNHMLKVIDTILYTKNWGWEYTNVDFNAVCEKSEKKLRECEIDIVNLNKQYELAKRNLDYDSIINMANNPSFKEHTQLPYIYDTMTSFKKGLDTMFNLNTLRVGIDYDKMIHARAVHRLNLRTRDFKPWKLYTSNSVYPDIFGTFVYDAETPSGHFDSRFIVPEDVGRLITKFVGHKFLSAIKQSFVVKRDPAILRDNLRSALSGWKKSTIIKYIRSSPYNHIKITAFNPFKASCHPIRLANNKSRLIESILTTFPDKERYYPFYRDVMLLTCIIQKNRRKRRPKGI